MKTSLNVNKGDLMTLGKEFEQREKERYLILRCYHLFLVVPGHCGFLFLPGLHGLIVLPKLHGFLFLLGLHGFIVLPKLHGFLFYLSSMVSCFYLDTMVSPGSTWTPWFLLVLPELHGFLFLPGHHGFS